MFTLAGLGRIALMSRALPERADPSIAVDTSLFVLTRCRVIKMLRFCSVNAMREVARAD